MRSNVFKFNSSARDVILYVHCQPSSKIIRHDVVLNFVIGFVNKAHVVCKKTLVKGVIRQHKQVVSMRKSCQYQMLHCRLVKMINHTYVSSVCRCPFHIYDCCLRNNVYNVFVSCIDNIARNFSPAPFDEVMSAPCDCFGVHGR